MPTLNIEGRKVKVDDSFLNLSPEDQQKAVEEIASSLGVQSQQAAAPTDPAAVAEDVAKAGGSGAVRGFAGLVQLPRDAGNWLGQKAGDALDSLMGISPEQSAINRQKAEALANGQSWSAPNVADKAVETLGSYQPKTTAGQYASTVGEMAPNALMPGGAVRKAASVVLPGVVSEAAGQVTEGTQAEPYARMAGAVAGGLASGIGASTSAAKSVLKAADAPETIPAKTKAAYDLLKRAGVKFDNGAYGALANDAERTVRNFRTQAPLTRDAVDYLKSFGNNGIGLDDLEDVRKNVSRILAEPNAMQADKEAARQILSKIDDFYDTAPAGSNARVLPANKITQAVKTARDYGRRNIILRDIEEMVRKGEYYKSGEESGLNNQFLNYLKKNSKRLNPAERDAFEAVGKGKGSLQNLVRIVGGFGIDPTRSGNISRLLPFLGAGAGAGSAYATGQDPWTGLAMGAAGLAGASALKMAGKQMIRNNVTTAEKVVAAGKTAQEAAAIAKLKASQSAKAKAALNILLTASPNREE